MQKIQKILGQKLQQLALTYKDNEKRYWQAFFKKQSLYFAFKDAASKIQQHVQVDDFLYIQVLSSFLSSKDLLDFKGAELFQAWIIYAIKTSFDISDVVNPQMIQSIQKIFSPSKKSLRKCIEQIAKSQYSPQKKFDMWLEEKQQKIQPFEQLVKSTSYYNQITTSKKRKIYMIREQQQQQQQQQIVKWKQKEEKVSFSLAKLEKEGILIMNQYKQLQQYPNLLQLQIQKHVIESFIKIYQLTQRRRQKYCKNLRQFLPLKLKSIEQILDQINKENRRISEGGFEKLLSMKNKLKKMQKENQFDNQNNSNMERYAQNLWIWQSIKQDLNIINIFNLKHLIKNTQQSAKHIKDKNILLLIGPSGAGKTTIMLKLLNYELQQTEINGLPTLSTKQPLKHQHSQLIAGPSTNSITKYIFSAKINPEFVSERQVQAEDGSSYKVKEDLYLCDTPGFFDTSGVVVDIANGVGMINAVKLAKTVKPIVVISAPMVGQKLDGVKQIGKIVSDLFNEYRRRQQGALTQFIFNKYQDYNQFNKLEQGLPDILKNMSSTEETDEKYKIFLQTLYKRLKQKSKIIKFDPLKIDIKNVLSQLSNNPIQNPNNVFKYSFSLKASLTLKNYLDNKQIIIMNLLYVNVCQARYHIKQFKTLLQIMPNNQDYKNIYQNLVNRISQQNKQYFTRFKLLVDQILQNQSTNQTIQQIKDIYDKLKSFNQLDCFQEIEVYQEQDLLNLIDKVFINLELTYKQYSFGNTHRSQFKKTIKNIIFFSQNFNFNTTILYNLSKYIYDHYQQANKEIKRCISQNEFNMKFKSLYEQYSNICIYFQLLKKDKPIRPEQMLIQRYLSIKQQVQSSQKMLQQYCNKFEKTQKKQLADNILRLQKNYHILQSIMSLKIMSKITQQNLKKKILGTFELVIKQSEQKCILIINSKEKAPQNIETLKNILQFLQQIIAFPKYKQQCQMIKDSIISSIKRDYDFQISSLEKIIQSLIKNKQIHSKFIDLDSILFKIRNYQFTDNSHPQKSQQLEQRFFQQFFFFFGNQKQKAQRMKISLQKNIKQGQVTNLINNIKGLDHLKKIKQQSIKQLIDQILDLQKKYIQRLILPYKQIQQCLPSNDSLAVKISKNLLNRIETFAHYDAHIAQMMNNKDYENIIAKIKYEHYENHIQQFFIYFYQSIKNLLSIINFQKNLFDNFTIETLKEFKKQINLLIYALKSDCILSQMSRLNYKDKFKFLEGQVIKMLDKSSQFLLQQFHNSVNKINFQTTFQNIRKYCLVMKEFDNEYDSQNIFSQIIKMIDNQYSKKQSQMINKLIYIFTESSVDYKQLRQFYLKNRRNSEIVQEIKNQIRKHDQLLSHKIDGMKKYEEDLFFQNQNLNYVRLIKEAYTFYCQITEFILNAGLKISLRVNNQYLKQSLKPFVSTYQHIYVKMMENICKLNYQTFPPKIQSFLTILQELAMALLPSQYNVIKENIQSIQFNADFKNKWNVSFIDKTITYRICQFNRALNESLQDDLQNVLDIFKPSSAKYYKYLKQEQKQKYLKSLKSQFQKKIQVYQKNSKEGKKQQLQMKQFFKLVPEQAQQQFQDQFMEIKMKIQSQRNINQQLFKAGENNFDQMVKIYEKVDKQGQRECVNRLIRMMINDFQSYINRQIKNRQIVSQYAKVCNKYKISIKIQQFQIKLQTKKRQLQALIIRRFDSLIQQNEDSLQKIDLDSIDQLRQNNRVVVEAYVQCIDKKLEVFLQLLERIQKYFERICQKYEKLVVFNPNFVQWERKDLQQYIKLQYFLTRTVQPISNELLYNKTKIIAYRRSQKILNILQDKNIDQCLQKIACQLIKIYQQINTFSLTNFINQMEQNPNAENLIKDHVQDINQKLNLLLEVSTIYNKCGLNKLRIKKNIDINDFSLFERNITKQLSVLFLQIQKLQNHPERKLSIRFSYISNLCQLTSNNIKQSLLSLLNNIKNDFIQKIQEIISRFQGQIQSFNNKISNKKKSKIAQGQDQIIQKIIANLIIMQKMQGKILFYKQFIRQRAVNLVQKIAKNEQLRTIIRSQIKEKITVLPQIKSLAKKHRLFRLRLQSQFPFSQIIQNQIFLKQFYLKNKNQRLQIDYESFEKSYKKTLDKYQQNNFEIVIEQISKNIHNQLAKISKIQTIGKIFGLHSILKGTLFKPHIAQIAAISLLLDNIQINQEIKSNVLEMLPGEGKSMVLAGVACYLALKGFDVYQICYTQYLANRDFQEFKELLSALKIQNRIKYCSLNQFCKSAVLPGSSEQLIKNELLQQVRQKKGGDKLQELFSSLRNNLLEQHPKNVILVDQVDILFSSKYEGKCFEPTIQIGDDAKSSEIKDILEYIYMQSKNSYLTESKLKNQPVYKKLLKKYSNIQNLLGSHVVMMLNDVLDKRQINMLFQKIKFNSEIQKKKIQKEDFFTGYHEAFAYIRLKQQSKKSEKAMKNKLKIHIRIGQFSYGEVVKKFGKILGVSGSLDCLSKYDKELLTEYYQIRNIYFIPSVFKKKQINYKCQIIDSQSKPKFYQKLVKHMQNQFKKQMSMIILFYTKEGIKKFYSHIINSMIIGKSKVNSLKINLIFDQSNFSNMSMITSPNTLNLASKDILRAIDYKDIHLTKTLYVIQTFIPENIYDISLAKKRTARGQKPGEFKLIIWRKQLQLKKVEGFENIKWNQQNFLKILFEQQQKSRNNLKLTKSVSKHNKTLQIFHGKALTLFLRQMNQATIKEKEGQFLILFCFQGNINHLQDYKQWLINILQQYQNYFKKNTLKIKLKYQVCYYGSYSNFNLGFQNIFKASKICQLIDLKAQLKSMKGFKFDNINQGMSIELFFNHLAELNKKHEIKSCFIWSTEKEYGWASFKKTPTFKKLQQKINTFFDFQQGIKMCKECLKKIKYAGIFINLIRLSRQPTFQKQIQELSLIYGKQLFTLIQPSSLNYKNLKVFFFQRMKKAIPYFENQ